MPGLRGESVGSAYVRLYADGSGVPGDIRRALDEAEPSVRAAGDEHGKQYTEAFSDSSSKSFKTHFDKGKNEMFQDLNDGLTASIRKLDLADSYFSSPAWRKFTDRMGDEFGDAGRLAAKRLEAEFRDSGDLKRLADRMKSVGADVRRAQADMVAALHADALQMNKEFDRLTEQRLIEQTRALADQHAEALEMNRDYNRALQKLREDQDKKYELELDHQKRIVDAHLAYIADREEAYTEHHRRELKQREDDITKHTRFIHNMADRMGSMFGRGSRNNFLNFVGSLVRGMVNIVAIIPRTIGYVQKLGGVFTDAGGGMAGFVQMAGMLGASLGTLALGVTGLVVVLGALVLIAGPVISILSGLLGIVTALAATIGYALVGAFAALLPLIIPLAAIIGGTIAAIVHMNDASGELEKSMDRVKESAKGLFDTFKDSAFENLPKYLELINKQLKSMDPLAEAVGKGFDRFIREFVKTATGPEMDKFFDRFTRFLPGAMERLGRIFGNVTEGLAGIFRASIPLVNRFLRWLEKVTDEFSEWANSKKGQKEIKQFLRDAGDSAEAFGGFLEDAWGFLKHILGSGRETGDNIFKDMGKDFERWTKWMEEHPDALTDWFEHADETAEDIGDLVDGMNELIDELDSADNRKVGSEFLNGIADALKVISTMSNTIELLINLVTADSKGQQRDVESLIGVEPGWEDKLRDKIESGVGGAFAGIGKIIERHAPDINWSKWTGVDALKKAWSNGVKNLPEIKWSKLANAKDIKIESLVAPFRTLPTKIGNAIQSIPGRIRDLFAKFSPISMDSVRNIAKPFGDLWSKISDRIGLLRSKFAGKMNELVESARDIPGRIADLFRDLAGAIIRAVGTISIPMSSFNLPDIKYLPPPLARGGFVRGPMTALIGEEGPEAVVPLSRPLHMVDPAVRELSAIAQGLRPMAAGGVVATTPTVDASNWTIVTPTKDPAAVAQEALNRIVAQLV